jgi:hypothetical protein
MAETAGFGPAVASFGCGYTHPGMRFRADPNPGLGVGCSPREQALVRRSTDPHGPPLTYCSQHAPRAPSLRRLIPRSPLYLFLVAMRCHRCASSVTPPRCRLIAGPTPVVLPALGVLQVPRWQDDEDLHLVSITHRERFRVRSTSATARPSPLTPGCDLRRCAGSYPTRSARGVRCLGFIGRLRGR